MNIIKNTFSFIFLVLNLIVGVFLLMAAFGQYLSPVSSPILSIAGLAFPAVVVLNLLFFFFWVLFRPKFALLPALLLLCTIDAHLTYCPIGLGEDATGGTKLKVMTYNVMGMPSEQGTKGKIVYPAVEYIKKSGADIVCLQEFPASHDELVRQLKPVYPYIKVVAFKSGMEVACLSKTRILSGERVDMISPGNGAGLFYVKYGEKKIPLIINHLESNKLSGNDKEIYESILEDPKNRFVKSGSKHLLFKLADAASLRGPQAKIISSLVKKLDNPHTIVCGDFNDTSLSYTHRVIADGLQDTYREAAFGPGATYHAHFMYVRIDHILVGQGYRVLNCKIDNTIDASDHYPYWCELEL